MISRTLRLYPTKEQAARLDEWFQIGTGVWNWALAQYIAQERDQLPSWFKPRVTEFWLNSATTGHATRVGLSSAALKGINRDVSRAWRDYRSGLRGKPHWKGQRNRLSSIPFCDGHADARSVHVPVFGRIKAKGFRGLPDAPIKMCRLIRKPRGWYFCVVLDAEPKAIPLVGDAAVGVDLGYSTLATLSTGEKIEHPNEYRRLAKRLGQAQRGHSRRVGRIQQSINLARRTRNHGISRDLVSRFGAIYVSKDNLKGFQRRWGKSVMNAAHGELREMLATKCRQAGRVYLEVSNRNSTRMCSSCGCLDGPTGLRGLSVREWACACGATHDRDINAAVNTLNLGAVLAHEGTREGASEISGHR